MDPPIGATAAATHPAPAGNVARATLLDLPCEILTLIVHFIGDDSDFCAARLAHRCFDVEDRATVHRTRRLPRWRRTDPHLVCRRNNVEAVGVLHEAGVRFDLGHVKSAAMSGAFDVVLVLCAWVCASDWLPAEIMEDAASAGRLDVVVGLHATGRAHSSPAAIDAAAATVTWT
ncbi:hypothetical protein pqer_cds_1084 [Pandoravirus quercus]|uniref:F-box domain containing protein n=1 Tax=Pandoravirus quercus TaxID=2107709 RepID=A0A2U7UAQ6_9VIRU|nr:hypothetical protein pqer_cds_1084 [Pandoravirus quercus]AVK75506.1 hypothetical protein pqer_cds_1084 [Pandoravirus quercus]